MKGTLLIALLAGATVGGMYLNNVTALPDSHQQKAVAQPNPTQQSLVLKKEVVKLYPNPSYNGTITISSNSEKPLHFYVFDVEGTLLHQVVLKNKEKQTIQNLKKGTYVYDAFLNDEGVDHGNISVR
jgi:hypothetical protein